MLTNACKVYRLRMCIAVNIVNALRVYHVLCECFEVVFALNKHHVHLSLKEDKKVTRSYLRNGDFLKVRLICRSEKCFFRVY